MAPPLRYDDDPPNDGTDESQTAGLPQGSEEKGNARPCWQDIRALKGHCRRPDTEDNRAERPLDIAEKSNAIRIDRATQRSSCPV